MPDHVSIINPPLAPAPTNSEDDVVEADGWWPSVGIKHFRAVARADETITPARVRAALQSAMATALIDLGAWGVSQRTQGYARLADVPTLIIDGQSRYLVYWQRAIYALAKAELIEVHRDYDATGKGERNADFVDDSIVQLRRDATHAIRDLKGRSRTTVELI